MARAKKTPQPAVEVYLTVREREVLWFLARGCDNQAIADALEIEPDTVRRHLVNVFRKTGSTNRVEAALFALRNGIAPLHPTDSD